MKNTVIATILAISLFPAPAFADVIYAGPQQVNVRYTPNALDIANSLAPAMYAIQQNSMVRQQQKQREQTKKMMDENVNNELEQLRQAAESDNLESADAALKQNCFSRNYTVNSGMSGNVYKLFASRIYEGLNVTLEYTVDYNLAQCRVVETIEDLQSVASCPFTLPQSWVDYFNVQQIFAELRQEIPNFDILNSWAKNELMKLPLQKQEEIMADMKSGDKNRVKSVYVYFQKRYDEQLRKEMAQNQPATQQQNKTQPQKQKKKK